MRQAAERHAAVAVREETTMRQMKLIGFLQAQNCSN